MWLSKVLHRSKVRDRRHILSYVKEKRLIMELTANRITERGKEKEKVQEREKWLTSKTSERKREEEYATYPVAWNFYSFSDE